MSGISILAATHLFILLPLPQLMIAAFVVLTARAVTRRLPQWIDGMAVTSRVTAIPALVAILLIGGYLALDLRVDVRYHQALDRTGGMTAFSDSIYDLADYLDERGYDSPYALDWGVKTNVIILTEGRVQPLEIFGQSIEPGDEFDRIITDSLNEPNPVFISQTEVSAAFPRLDRFREVVEANGRQVIQEEIFRQRDGVPAYYLFRVSPLTTAETP